MKLVIICICYHVNYCCPSSLSKIWSILYSGSDRLASQLCILSPAVATRDAIYEHGHFLQCIPSQVPIPKSHLITDNERHPLCPIFIICECVAHKLRQVLFELDGMHCLYNLLQKKFRRQLPNYKKTYILGMF